MKRSAISPEKRARRKLFDDDDDDDDDDDISTSLELSDSCTEDDDDDDDDITIDDIKVIPTQSKPKSQAKQTQSVTYTTTTTTDTKPPPKRDQRHTVAKRPVKQTEIHSSRSYFISIDDKKDVFTVKSEQVVTGGKSIIIAHPRENVDPALSGGHRIPNIEYNCLKIAGMYIVRISLSWC